MKELPLSQGKIALVDDDIFDFLSQFKWSLMTFKHSETIFYSSTYLPKIKGIKGNILLHHVIIGTPIKPFVVDHINGNGLDNRRENLRITTKSKNQRNRYTHRAGRLLGCYWDKSRNKWRAQVYMGRGQYKNLGRFETELEAHKAYLAAQALSPCK